MADYGLYDDTPNLMNDAFEVFYKNVILKATVETVDVISGIIDQQYAGKLKHGVR